MFFILITMKDFKLYVKLKFKLIVNRNWSRKFWISLTILNLCFPFFIPYVIIKLYINFPSISKQLFKGL